MNREKINKLITNITTGIKWEQAFNEIDEEYTDVIIDIIAEQEIELLKILEDITVKSYNLQYELSNLDLEQDCLSLSDSVNESFDKNLEIMKTAISFKEKNNELTKILVLKIKEFTGETLLDRLKIYLDENIDVNKMQKRIEIFAQKLIQISTSLSKLNVDGLLILNKNLNTLEKLKKYCHTKNKIELNKIELRGLKLKELININANKKEQYSKIFDYKEMVRKAKKEGYVVDRFNGDHMVLVHQETQKIIVIPHHELGFGIMKVIQQQIKENKVA